jgi:hypothetical protein
VVLAFLQRTRSPDPTAHQVFYDSVAKQEPTLKALLSAMSSHDSIDAELGHADDIIRLVSVLTDRHNLEAETLAYAARVTEHSWAFLAGICDQYGSGKLHTIAQRVGWSARGIAS